MRRLPPLGSIQAFVHVARLGTMKAAADSLALSSPAMSRRIQGLEQFVGTSLFHRQNNSILLTTSGETFLSQISPHLDALALAVEKVSERTHGMRLQIAVPSLFAAQRLMPMLPSLQHQFPDLHINVDSGATRLSRVGEDVDVAIAIASAVDSRLYAKVIEEGRIVALGSRRSFPGQAPILHPEDLSRVPVLLHRAMPDAFDAWRKSIGMPGLEPKAIIHYDAGQLILDAVAEGIGIAFMLESHLKHSVDDRLVQVFEATVDSPYSYWFACDRAALERPPVRVFHDWLFEQFRPA